MISVRHLDRVRTALRIVRRLELTTESWAVAAGLIRDLVAALHARDDERLRVALARLERLGATRSDWPGRADLPAEPDVAVPVDLAADLDKLEADVLDVAVELRRVPHIDVDPAGPLQPGDRVVAAVYLDTTTAGPDETTEPVVLPRGGGEPREMRVEVWLTTSAHFEIDGPSTATIVVRSDAERSTVAYFPIKVRAGEEDNDVVPALRASFDYHLRPAGAVVRALTVVGSRETELAGSVTAGAIVQSGARPSDLEVLVRRVPGRTDKFDVVLRTGLLGGQTIEDEWYLEEGAEAYVRRIMAEFVAPAATPKARWRSLEGAGITFFNAAPREFRELYWRLLDAGTPLGSMFLVSDERAVPWELMIPRRRAEGGWQTMPPLGVSCAVGRWHHDEHLSPSQRIPLCDSLVLAPDYPGELRLPHAEAERDLVVSLYAGQEAPATFDELDAFYAANSASLLHFVCHGRDETLQAILLLGKQTLSAQQLLTSGIAEACRARRPLVFLNVCEVGRPGTGLVGVGGFPSSFIASDAGGVVAPLWSVEDRVAHQVAVEFYAAVTRDPARPFADILRELRGRAYAEGGADTFAAYAFYGDPLTAVVRP